MKKIAFLLIVCWSCQVYAEDYADVTPYRPSVSNPAQLPAAGQLELEVGGLRTKTGAVQRDSVPYQFKLGFNREWGVLVGGEAQVLAHNADGTHDRGAGDTTVVLKRAVLVDDATAYGAEFGIKLPTANAVIGSGKSDYVLNTIFSKDIAKLHIDANINFTRVGLIEPETGRTQTGMSVSFSMPLAEKWGANLELSGVRRPGVPTTSQLLLAGTYSPTKKMTFDFGIAKGLTSASQDWSIFSGIVIPVAKFW